MKFLAETALLTHGLLSVTQEELQAAWPVKEPVLVWVDQGKLIRGTLEEYLPFRARAKDAIRIDCTMFDRALETGLTGALTASGTMAACQKFGIPLAISCGIGGIGPIRGEEVCPDLPAMADLPVALMATGPKDMLDIQATVDWLVDRGVHVAGDVCTGYLFAEQNVILPETAEAYADAVSIIRGAENGGLLLLRSIPPEKRVKDVSILTAAVAVGRQAQQEGRYFHPAVNGEIDRLTRGYSSRIQLEAFVDNIRTAAAIL